MATVGTSGLQVGQIVMLVGIAATWIGGGNLLARRLVGRQDDRPNAWIMRWGFFVAPRLPSLAVFVIGLAAVAIGAVIWALPGG